MTVRELKEKLEAYPNDWLVKHLSSEDGIDWDDYDITKVEIQDNATPVLNPYLLLG